MMKQKLVSHNDVTQEVSYINLQKYLLKEKLFPSKDLRETELLKTHLKVFLFGRLSCFSEAAIRRCSSKQMFFKIYVFKIFAIFTGKHLCWSLFLIKLQA